MTAFANLRPPSAFQVFVNHEGQRAAGSDKRFVIASGNSPQQ